MNDQDSVSVREYFAQRIAELDRLFDARVRAIQDAIDKSESTLNERTRNTQEQLSKRLDSMNEFRDALKDQAARMITRAEYDVGHQAVLQQIRRLELDFAERAGQSKNAAIVAAIMSSVIVGVVIAVITHWLIKP